MTTHSKRAGIITLTILILGLILSMTLLSGRYGIIGSAKGKPGGGGGKPCVSGTCSCSKRGVLSVCVNERSQKVNCGKEVDLYGNSLICDLSSCSCI